eukprot:TRINITY_DN55767_c0_g1_i1.p1 TRINITY_DN55767_c0_g1~~TRINITY_DN55767_c0_g1_i1.p1  ORF type:complete len:582 (-),score=134.61 TRINITY_DN55767_c0_g1_i1:84-1829(-)
MRVTVVRTDGVPEDCILSVKAGEQRRQMPLSCEGQTFCFEGASDGTVSQPVRFDLLSRLATCAPGSLGAGEHHFEVASAQGGAPMTIVLRVDHDVGAAAGGAAAPGCAVAGTPATGNVAKSFGASQTLTPMSPVNFGQSGSLFGREAKIASDAHTYLEHHKLLQAMRAGLARVLRERPALPHQMLADEIARLTGAGYPVPVRAPASEMAAAGGDELFGPPVPLPSGPTLRIVDFGSGETGFYSYGSPGDARQICQLGDKLSGGLMADFVSTNRASDLAESLLERYDLVKAYAQRESAEPLVVYGGATGSNRELLEQSGESRAALRTFTRAVQQHLCEALGGGPSCCQLRIFVPSGTMEAQYELRAVEWLLAQSSDRGSSATADLAFSGTISAGGGSSQLSLRRGTLAAGAAPGEGGAGSSTAQLFSAPLGNKKPASEKLFSCPPTPAEVDAWTDQVQQGLASSNFPRGIEGLVVGISATFYAAKEAGIDDRIISKAEAVEAFSRRLAAVLNCGTEAAAAKAAMRSAANVALVRALVQHALHDDCRILFRRNWKVGEAKAAATWSLGLYAEAQAARGAGGAV